MLSSASWICSCGPDSDGDGIGDDCEVDAANLDNQGNVNFADMAILANSWKMTAPSLPGDIDSNGTVNELDLKQIAENWLKN